MVGLFAKSSEVEHLDLTWSTLSGSDRLDALGSLAWYIRQSRISRSQKLVTEAQDLVDRLTPEDPGRDWAPRLTLIRAEQAWVMGQLDEAERLLVQAEGGFTRCRDPFGLGDVRWVRAFLLYDRGDNPATEACLDEAADHYRKAGDLLRVGVTQARKLVNLAYQNPGKASEIAGSLFGDLEIRGTFVSPFLEVVQGVIASMTGDLGLSIRTYSQAYRESLDFGILRLALVSAGNISVGYSRLGVLEESLEWAERAYRLVEDTGAPGLNGMSRTMMAGVLQSLGRYAEARKYLNEALGIMAAESGSRNYANIYYILGDVALSEGNFDDALGWFRKLGERAEALDGIDFRLSSLTGQAETLAHMGRDSEALGIAFQALEKARNQQDTEMEVRLLRLLAGLHLRNAISPATDEPSAQAHLRILGEALAAARAQPDYMVPADLLDDLGAACAAAGDHRRAYFYALEATEERSKAQLQAVQNRAVAMQIKHETDQIRAEAEKQRQLAAGERLRAETLQSANATLETLGRIGREITATLNVKAVCETLYRHIHGLLTVTTFMVFGVDDDGRGLHGLFGTEDDRPLELPVFPLDDPTSNMARCARDRTEIVLDLEDDPETPTLIPGSRATRSLLYAPLVNAGRLLGVISIQADRPGAYGERECSIFRALCAYGAIALANAVNYAQVEAAHAQIQKNQTQLIASEKMASLGRLTAGIAHEMNTPIAAVRAALEGLGRLAAEVEESAGDPEVKPDDYREIAGEMKELLTLARNSSGRAASFIRSIKTQTREGNVETKVEFDLVAATADALTLLDFALGPKGIHICRKGPDTPVPVQGNPARYAQVVTNLVNNAIDAVPAQGGAITVTVDLGPRGPRVLVADNGPGIPPEVLPRIFDPLFTTKRFGEGTGLGLTIVRDIVTGEFGGTIEVDSGPGRGTTFVLGFGE